MGFVFKLLLALGIIIGMHGRGHASESWRVVTHAHECGLHAHEHDHGHGNHDPIDSHETPGPCDPCDDEDCPPGHHHHHSHCCQGSAMPLIDAVNPSIRLPIPASSLARLVDETEEVPEGPLLSEDEPPLI